MPERTKTIFVSDVHLGDQTSWDAKPYPYCWCMDNVGRLGEFLRRVQKDQTVQEVVLLGDLFDAWIIPASYSPITSFSKICEFSGNKAIIDPLSSSRAWGDIKVYYVLGNHDMPFGKSDIKVLTDLMKNKFPHVQCLFDEGDPLGKYERGHLLAEHGNRYCLFNGLDRITNKSSFLPLGYFISRLIATWAVNHGNMLLSNIGDYIKVAYSFISNLKNEPNFFENMLASLTARAHFNSDDLIRVDGLLGYSGPMSWQKIGECFKNSCENWSQTPGNVNLAQAFTSEVHRFWLAAQRQMMGGKKIVIFGHTHEPGIYPEFKPDDYYKHIDTGKPISDFPYDTIYANCGGWVDKRYYPGHECTYIETEEIEAPDGWRQYVRVKQYQEKEDVIKSEGFVKTYK